MSGELATVKIASDKEQCRAIPSELLVKSGSGVEFHNLGSGQVTVLFPDEKLFNQKSMTLEEGEKRQAQLSYDYADKVIYSYEVFSHVSGMLTSRATRPIIIVYPSVKD